MPRKEWVPQNPYCRRSKLDEDEFNDVMASYFLELLQSHTRDYFREYTANTSWQTWHRQKLPTRQAIGRYYEKISQYIWERFIVCHNPIFEKEDAFDELIDLVYEKTNKISNYDELYHSFNDFPFYIKKDKITRSLMFHLLSSRSKIIRGFKREVFYLEFSRVFFMCAVIETLNIEFQSIYSVNELKKSYEITWACVRMLKSFLMERPL